MKNNLKIFFLMMIFFSSLFLISSNSWLNMWIWLEVNLISFISFIMNNNNKLTIESSLIYFFIQTIASILLLFSILIILFLNKMINLLTISILIKLGSAPFHFWMPLMIESLNWFSIFILLTWQKINPLIMIFYNFYNKILNLFIFLSLLIGSISSLNYLSLKKIISFSSINQLGWILMTLNINKLFKLYLMFYFYLMFIIMNTMKIFNLNFLNDLFNLSKKKKLFMKMFLFSNFMSLGGLPPFLGFFPKMMIIMKMNNFMIFFMILFSLIMLFMYLRIILSFLTLNSVKINLINFKINNFKMYLLMNTSLMNNFFIMLLFFIY